MGPLLSLLLLLPSQVARAQNGCEVTDVRKADGFNLFTGVATMKDESGNFVQTTLDEQGMKLFDKNGTFMAASISSEGAAGEKLTTTKKAEELATALANHLGSRGEIGPATPLSRLDLSTVKAVDFDITTGQATFHDEGGNCLVATTTIEMSFDFLSSDSRTGAKLFLDRQIAWAMAEGTTIPLTDAAGKTLRDVALPSAIKEGEAKASYR
jgi:hypothetical protein